MLPKFLSPAANSMMHMHQKTSNFCCLLSYTQGVYITARAFTLLFAKNSINPTQAIFSPSFSLNWLVGAENNPEKILKA